MLEVLVNDEWVERQPEHLEYFRETRNGVIVRVSYWFDESTVEPTEQTG